jgi:hypothetical protein
MKRGLRLHQRLLSLFPEWDTNPDYSHKFYAAYSKETDYGTCCFIIPYLDFINEETKNLDPGYYDPGLELNFRFCCLEQCLSTNSYRRNLDLLKTLKCIRIFKKRLIV